jgi:hypothetical protein
MRGSVSLGIDEGAVAKNSRLLLEIDGGRLSADVQRGRGHCHVIGHIYRNYLDKWLSKALNADEYASIGAAFQTLGDADRHLFEDLETRHNSHNMAE